MCSSTGFARCRYRRIPSLALGTSGGLNSTPDTPHAPVFWPDLASFFPLLFLSCSCFATPLASDWESAWAGLPSLPYKHVFDTSWASSTRTAPALGRRLALLHHSALCDNLAIFAIRLRLCLISPCSFSRLATSLALRRAIVSTWKLFGGARSCARISSLLIPFATVLPAFQFQTSRARHASTLHKHRVLPRQPVINSGRRSRHSFLSPAATLKLVSFLA